MTVIRVQDNQRMNVTPIVFCNCFIGITELTIKLGGSVEKRVANMTDELWEILDMMGKECEKYYV